MATSARSASRVVVRPSYPTSSTSSAQASSMRWTRATLLPCTGTRRSGPVVTVGVDTRRHSLSAVIIGTLLGSTSEKHRRDAGGTGHTRFCATVRPAEGQETTPQWRNWAGNERAVATGVLTPAGPPEVAALIRTAAERGRRVKVVGTGHSMPGIAVADDQRMELDRLTGPLVVDGDLVTVPAAMPMSRLNALLAARGLAVPNLGDIDAQTVAGAISTGTHGTGMAYSTLASCVAAVTLVTGTGQIIRVDAGSELFPAVRLGLGALGVLVDVTLRCV